MNEKFKDVRFKPASLRLVGLCRDILEEYQEQDLRLTLRQLYYQLVSKNVIPNLEKSYKSLGKLISQARLGGYLDWDAIEDRMRIPISPPEFEDLHDLVSAAVRSYRLPRWKGQEHYVELWVEKDALSGVLAPLANEYHVTLVVNRGYSSQSAMYEASKRIKQQDVESSSILYLGDHDPSGEDMVRDIQDRLEMFGVEDIVVEKLALTFKQVETYKPPPNPAKVSDSRYANYVRRYGRSCWEVDALPPKILQRLIRRAIEKVLDQDKVDEIIKRENRDTSMLWSAVTKKRLGR